MAGITSPGFRVSIETPCPLKRKRGPVLSTAGPHPKAASPPASHTTVQVSHRLLPFARKLLAGGKPHMKRTIRRPVKPGGNPERRRFAVLFLSASRNVI
jgi:hypothetical protein